MAKKVLIAFLTVIILIISCPPLYSGEIDTVSLATSDAEWPPYRFQSSNGEGTQGLFVDLISELFEKDLGIVVERRVFPWKRAQEKVEVGTADFMVTVPTPERLEYAVKTAIPIHRMYLYLYVYANHPKRLAIDKIKTVDDIRRLKLKLAAHVGDGWYKSNVSAKGVESHYISYDESLVRFIAAKRADGIIDALLPTNRIINDNKLQSKITLTDIKFGPIDFYVLISKKSPLVDKLDDINAALHRMSESGRIAELVAKYDE